MENKTERFYLIDNLRGIMILGVVLFHFFFDLYFVGLPIGEKIITSDWFNIIAVTGRTLFVFIAGICSRLSHNNLKRALIVIGGAAFIQLVTFLIDIVMFDDVGVLYIYFGILHLLGTCMLIYGLFEKLFNKIKINSTKNHMPSVIIAVLLFTLFVGAFNFENNTLFGIHINTYENGLYGTYIGSILGFSGYELHSADYFPIIPWAFAFFSGAFIGVFFKEDRVPAVFHKNFCPLLSVIGSKTLYIYILHQPLVYGIAILINHIAVTAL